MYLSNTRKENTVAIVGITYYVGITFYVKWFQQTLYVTRVQLIPKLPLDLMYKCTSENIRKVCQNIPEKRCCLATLIVSLSCLGQ